MKVVKSLIFILFALCSLSGKAQEVTADSTGYIVRVGEMAPNFTITLTDGKKVTLSELRGKVVMLQFTASWCGVCRKEMPFIEKDIWLKHKDNSAFALIGIDRDEPLDKVIALRLFSQVDLKIRSTRTFCLLFLCQHFINLLR